LMENVMLLFIVLLLGGRDNFFRLRPASLTRRVSEAQRGGV
jgi:hypothetical protein